MSDSKRILLLNKIKNKIIIFEHIQGFVSHRHFILPFLFENDKILRSQLKHMFVISKQNTHQNLWIIFIPLYQIKCFMIL